ncbi:glycosyltransferase family 2 protein [Cecembia calidifontis]|uniref:GT2 family glycosyltransferase n=1 Tax=Cecembia calidifontis TaxID=1187080 RepID=A0A4Q7PDM1_9BACT|nr:glycosyltransferase family A protein [Cecembia calidifontis]RZS98476.1 GT2 family glycosyltransferase [Cecembia calidifontis]
MNLYVCISTYGDRIFNLANVILDPRKDVKYIVAHQIGNTSKKDYKLDFLNRSDVEYYQLQNKGVSKSRNFAIKKVPLGNIIWILDDDVKILSDAFDNIFQAYSHNKDADFISFKIKTLLGEPPFKNYLKSKKKIKSIDDYEGPKPSIIEMTFRSSSINKNRAYFDERFGAGSFLIGGEENLFIHGMIKKGFCLYFSPIYLVVHPFESTRNKYKTFSKERLRYLGAHYYIFLGFFSFIRLIVSPIKHRDEIKSKKSSIIKNIYFSMQGFLYLLVTDIIKMKYTRYK